jgi:hypothetical protein
MLRFVVLALLVVNAAFFAWTRGWLGEGLGSPFAQAEREPERLVRQVNGDAVRLLTPQAASAALTVVAQLAAASEPGAARCVQSGPFAGPDAAAAEKAARDAGAGGEALTVTRGERGGLFIIYMGRYADRDALARKLDELKRLKVDAEELRNAPELAPGLSLGRFAEREAADAALAGLAEKGLRTAKVIVMTAPVPTAMLRVRPVDDALQVKLAALKLPGGQTFRPCATE